MQATRANGRDTFLVATMIVATKVEVSVLSCKRHFMMSLTKLFAMLIQSGKIVVNISTMSEHSNIVVVSLERMTIRSSLP